MNYLCIADDDFVPAVAASLSLTGNDGEECLSVSIIDNNIVERDETFSVLLSSSNNAVDITLNSATITIIDNDMVTIGWRFVPDEFDESGASATVCAEIVEGDIARQVTVVYSTMDNTAQSNVFTFACLYSAREQCPLGTVYRSR